MDAFDTSYFPSLPTECLARLGLKPVFVSAIGTDPLGVMLLKHFEELKMVKQKYLSFFMS